MCNFVLDARMLDALVAKVKRDIKKFRVKSLGTKKPPGSGVVFVRTKKWPGIRAVMFPRKKK